VKVGESIIACYSNALPGIDESIAVVYGHYHELHQKMPVVDDLFSDTLLLHLGIWVKENQREGSRSLSLAKKVFKPELCI
jgi:hypothetical protein